MNFFNKYKLVVFMLVVFLFPYFAQAGTCLPVGYSVFTINGINTDIDGTTENRDVLKDHLPPIYNNQKITVDFLHNKTHGKIIDSLDTTNQIYFDQNSLNIQDSDFAQMLTDASAKVTTQKLLLVGHSQGNFYANTFYDAVADEPGGVPSESIGVYGVGTPATHVAGNGLYLTSDTDKMIAGTVAKFPLTNILKSNAHINFNASDGDPLGHSFSKIYLAYEGSRIVSEIKTSLNKLQNNNIQKENSSCINPPKLTLTQKIQGTVLAIVDPISIPTQKIVVNTITGSYKVATTIGNSVLKGVSIIASSISSFAQSLFNNKSLAINNSAVVIAADNQLLDVSQSSLGNSTTGDTTPEPVKENSKPTTKATSLYKITAVQSKPEITETVQATLAIAPAIEIKNTTTEEKIITSDTSQNLYPNLLPGGGGVATSNVFTPDSAPSLIIPDTTPPVISIIGLSPVSINTGSIYADLGATALDNIDGAINVVTSGTFDSSVVGVYIITYTATDLSNNIATLTRTVNVVAPPVPPTPDVTPPVITILGNNPETIIAGNSYTDAGATAFDDVDGARTVVAGIASVNTAIVGAYTITYTATDLSGNIATATRAVNVVASPPPPPDTTPPVISLLTLTPSSGSVGIGGIVTLTITADGADYTAGTITVNNVATTGFTNIGGNNYTATYTVTSGNSNRSSGTIPASVILTDTAGNSNVAYTAVAPNTLTINGQISNSAIQIFPSFTSDGSFTQDIVLPCATNLGDHVMYAITDADGAYNFMNQTTNGDISCPGGVHTAIGNGQKFPDFLGYRDYVGWYYVAVFLNGTQNCIHAIGINCILNSPYSFVRLHRNAAGVWSDTDI